MLKEGQKAPNFTLRGSNDKEVSLKDYHGQNVVLYFYPKDMTPGCTTEACDFRDEIEHFRGKETVILGVSCDDTPSHRKFIDKNNLNFILLTDTDAKVCKEYGAWDNKINRTTVIVDREGTIKKIYNNVKVDGHVKDVLDSI